MLLLKGTPAAFNYTYGPALVYRGPSSIDLIYLMGEPVVVVADMIPLDEIRKMELTRIRGFVFEQGTATEDEDLYNFFMTEKRAAVLSCEHATEYICDGDMVIVDGVEGYVCLEPNDETLEAFQKTRKLGPPTDKGAAVQNMARAILDGLVKEREEKEARGEKIVKSGEVMTVAEAKAASAAQPGIIYQLLTGLPLPNSPTAGDHGHQHPPGEEHAHGEHAHGEHAHEHEHEAGRKPDPAADRRAARDAKRASRDDEEKKPSREEEKRAEKAEAAPGEATKPPIEAKPAELTGAAARKAAREAEMAAAQSARSKKDEKKEEAAPPPSPPPAPAAKEPARVAAEPEAPAAAADDDDPLGYQT